MLFYFFSHLFRNFGFLFPFTYHDICSICGFLYPVSFKQYTCSVSQAIPVSTNCKLIFLLSSFFPKLSWPHLSQKWSLLIRARTWWASNIIFADNSCSSSGVFWLVDLVFCWLGFVYFFLFFLSFLSWVSATGKSLSLRIYFLGGSWFLSFAAY